MSASWLYKQAAARAVPFRKFGSEIRFFDDDIAEILAQHRQMPRSAITPISSARRRRAA